MVLSSEYIAVRTTEHPACAPTCNHMHNKAQIHAGPDCDLAENITRLEPAPIEQKNVNSARPSVVLSKVVPGFHEPAHFVKWGIHWLVPAQMLSLFVAGIGLAIGHHYYYHSLAGTEVMPATRIVSQWDIGRQEWKIRFGTAFAFLAKTCLATAIAIAYTQHVWASCRRKAYSVSGLDALFSATSDVFAFASFELTLRAKVGALLAALVW